jgi:hypothetical protein
VGEKKGDYMTHLKGPLKNPVGRAKCPAPMGDNLLSPIEAGIHPASKYDLFNTP